MLLRASSKSIEVEADLRGAIGEGDGGVAHGDVLTRFAEAATRGDDDLDEARQAALDAIGPECFVEAAATIGAFNGLVRVADSTGIPSDSRTLEVTASARRELGLNAFAGARSSGVAETAS
ncbi:MAG: hypothetical protein VYE73_10880 [Acidobacteriota bacterium]|nr:hypothetical protein [Acidobacteriota bacterium]